MEILDEVERKTLIYSLIGFFLFSFFLSLNLKMKILLFGSLLYFLIFFFLNQAWAEPKNPEIKFQIGFFNSLFHTFLFLLAGLLGIIFSFLSIKFFPPIFDFLKKLFFP